MNPLTTTAIAERLARPESEVRRCVGALKIAPYCVSGGVWFYSTADVERIAKRLGVTVSTKSADSSKPLHTRPQR